MTTRVLHSLLAVFAGFLVLPAVMAQGNGAFTINPGDGPRSAQRPQIKPLIQDPGPIGAATTTALFAHVAVGGGWNTVFTLLNTGSSPVDGNLVLTANDGTPLNVSVDTPSPTLGSSIPISIPPGGIQVLTANSINASDPTKSGWAQVLSSGGQLGGVGTFRYFDTAGHLITTAGVLSGNPVTVATIPVDNDNSRSQEVGYAVANVGTSPLTIKVVVVDVTGAAQKTFNISLNAGAQTARFLFQDGASFSTFKGSMVLIGQGGGSFAVIALVQDGPLYTVIPVIPAKAANIN